MRLPGRTVSAPLLLGLLAWPSACGARGAPGPLAADLILHNARIVTMDETTPEAEAIAIKGDTIVGVGTRAELEALVGPSTRVHDLGGRTIVPGLNDTHLHVRDLGFEQRTAVNLEPARNVADVQKLLRERLATLERENRLDGWRYPTTGETGPWLFGLGWTQDRLEERRMATRQELDDTCS